MAWSVVLAEAFVGEDDYGIGLVDVVANEPVHRQTVLSTFFGGAERRRFVVILAWTVSWNIKSNARRLFKPCGSIILALPQNLRLWFWVQAEVGGSWLLKGWWSRSQIGLPGVSSHSILPALSIDGRTRLNEPPSCFIVFADIIVALYGGSIRAFVLINDPHGRAGASVLAHRFYARDLNLL